MQDLHDGDQQSTGATDTDPAGRVLEDPRDLALEKVARLGPRLAMPERRDLDGIRWYRIRVQYLEWRQPVALSFLWGAQVADVLAPNYALINGVHRPIWSSRPGVDNAELAFFPWPPAGVPPLELMVKVIASVRNT
jgi:hypothetical protein